MKAFFLKFFMPKIFVIMRDQYLGDDVKKVTKYEYSNSMIKFKDETNSYLYPIDKVFLRESSAKKEIQKNSLTYDENHVMLLKSIESKGIKLTPYGRQQVLEDGEISEIYQELVKEGKI